MVERAAASRASCSWQSRRRALQRTQTHPACARRAERYALFVSQRAQVLLQDHSRRGDGRLSAIASERGFLKAARRSAANVDRMQDTINRGEAIITADPPAKVYVRAGALVETGRGGPSDHGLPVEGCVALARVEARDVWLREIERTLHVLGDVAVALSSFEAYEPDSPDPSRGVNVVRLRKARGAWQVEGVTSRPIEHAVTIRRTLAPSSGPRPPPRAA